MLLSTEENVNYEFILPAKNTILENIQISHSANGQLDWTALCGPNVIGSSAMHVIGQACVCWWILLLLCIRMRSGKAGLRRLLHYASFGLTTRKDMSITLLVNDEGIKYLFHSDLLSYLMFSIWSGYDSALSEWTGWDHKIPLSRWIQVWIPATSSCNSSSFEYCQPN